MAAAQGNCPNCGAPIEFAVGSSLAKVCEFCRNTVVRSDRGLAGLGKVADLADTPCLIAIGDEGTLAGRPLRVMGRVQLDHGKGPWDEYYVAFDHGQSWGWLAYAQGQWFATSPILGLSFPRYDELRPEADVVLGSAGSFRVAEVRTGTIVSAEGELPDAFPQGFVRRYADLWGPRQAFATLDYGDLSGASVAFLGWAFPESQLSITALGPRSTKKVAATTIKCPSCGGDVPALAPDRSERLGCPYCGAVSDIAERKVVAQQERARAQPVIPIGSQGTFDGVSYVCIAQVRRGSTFDDELYEWEEFLLWSQGIGFRWLVLDPETGWSFVSPVNLAELDLSWMPDRVGLTGRWFTQRNRNTARVSYVLGEVYWKCEVGEATQVMDFVHGEEVLSREEAPGEVIWSQSSPLDWPTVAQAFRLPLAKYAKKRGAKETSPGTVLLVVVILVLLVGIAMALPSTNNGVTTSSGTTYSGGFSTGPSVPGGGISTYRGGGVFSGGK
jgi:hypothetical protein